MEIILHVLFAVALLTPSYTVKSDKVEEIDPNNSAKNLIIKNATGVISEENLSSFKDITDITITKSEITEIKSGSLCSSLPKLNSISIYKNKKFLKITKNLFKNCQQLKKIYIDEAGLEVENGAFTETGSLEALTLNDTIFPSDVIDKTTLEGLDSLESLTIQNSKIREISEDVLKNMKKLKYLDLQGNQISEIKGGTLSGLSELKVLNLSNNKLAKITWDEFQGLKSLRVLFLERNAYEYVDVEKLVKNIPNLDRIFLDFNKLSPDNRKEITSTLPKYKINVIYADLPAK